MEATTMGLGFRVILGLYSVPWETWEGDPILQGLQE